MGVIMNEMTVERIEGYLRKRQEELSRERENQEMNAFNLGKNVGSINEIVSVIEFINGIENPNK